MAHSITRGSLDSSIQDMEAALEGCSFIAIDFEMTGIGPWRQDQADTAQVSGVPVQINFHSTGKTSTHALMHSLTHSLNPTLPPPGLGEGLVGVDGPDYWVGSKNASWTARNTVVSRRGGRRWKQTLLFRFTTFLQGTM